MVDNIDEVRYTRFYFVIGGLLPPITHGVYESLENSKNTNVSEYEPRSSS